MKSLTRLIRWLPLVAVLFSIALTVPDAAAQSRGRGSSDRRARVEKKDTKRDARVKKERRSSRSSRVSRTPKKPPRQRRTEARSNRSRNERTKAAPRPKRQVERRAPRQNQRDRRTRVEIPPRQERKAQSSRRDRRTPQTERTNRRSRTERATPRQNRRVEGRGNRTQRGSTARRPARNDEPAARQGGRGNDRVGRGTQRGDRRIDNRQGRRGNDRVGRDGNRRGDRRIDNRQGRRGDRRIDNRQGRRGNDRVGRDGNRRGDRRGDARVGNRRGDNRVGNRRGDRRGDNRVGNRRGDRRGDARIDGRRRGEVRHRHTPNYHERDRWRHRYERDRRYKKRHYQRRYKRYKPRYHHKHFRFRPRIHIDIHWPWIHRHRHHWRPRYRYRQVVYVDAGWHGQHRRSQIDVRTYYYHELRHADYDRADVDIYVERIELYEDGRYLGTIDQIPDQLGRIQATVYRNGRVRFDRDVFVIGDSYAGFELISTRHYDGFVLDAYHANHGYRAGVIDLRRGRAVPVNRSRLFDPYDFQGFVPVSLLPEDQGWLLDYGDASFSSRYFEDDPYYYGGYGNAGEYDDPYYGDDYYEEEYYEDAAGRPHYSVRSTVAEANFGVSAQTRSYDRDYQTSFGARVNLRRQTEFVRVK